MARGSDARIEAIVVRAATVPTDAPESDGTLEWDRTTLVLCSASSGRETGYGWTYADPAAGRLAKEKLAPIVLGRDAFDVESSHVAMASSLRNLGRTGSSRRSRTGTSGRSGTSSNDRLRLGRAADGARVARRRDGARADPAPARPDRAGSHRRVRLPLARRDAGDADPRALVPEQHVPRGGADGGARRGPRARRRGGRAARLGSLGLVTLRSFFQRVHAPTTASTLGTWSLALATALQASFLRDGVFAHALLVPAFVALTAPVTTIFLMRAAVFRRRVTAREALARGKLPTSGDSARGQRDG
jgi:multicomponent K+:H+ antiporter subunit G